MNSLRRAAPLSLLLFGGRLGGAALAFATQALIARAWGAAVLGDYLFVLAIANVAAAIMPLGFQTVGGYFAAQYRATGSRRSLSAYLTQGHAQLALLAAAFLIAAGVATAWADAASSRPSLWLPAVVMAMAIAVVYLNGSVLAGLRRPVAALVADTLLRPMLMLCGFAVVVPWSTAQPLAPMLWVMAGSYSVVAIVHTVVTATTVRGIPDDAPLMIEQKRQWWRYALPWALVGLATDLFFDIDLVILAHFLSREDLALFGVCARICSLLAFGVGAVYTVMMPDILEAGVKRNEAQFRARIDDANGVAFVIAILLAIAMLGSGPVLGWVFGAEFAKASMPLGIMALGLVFRAGFGPAALVLSFHDRPSASVPAAIAGLAALVIANIVLVPLFGLLGAASAATIAMAIWAITQWHTAHRLLALDVSLYPRLKTYRPSAMASRMAQRRARESATPLS